MTGYPELFVFSGSPRLTGVSTTIANLMPVQAARYRTALVGHDLPGCAPAIPLAQARRLCVRAPKGRPFAIWHLRRDQDMRAGIWARDVLRLPVRLVFTSAAQRRHSALPRWLIRQMDAVIATTDKAAGFLEHPAAAVVPHGIATARFTPADDRAAAWQALGFGGQQGVATVGRIRPDKGTDLFLSAMIPVLRVHPGTVALIIGLARGSADRGFEQALRQRAAQAGVDKQVRFTGVVENYTQLPKILRAVSVLANLPRHEEFGVVPLEAMASGTPFVGSDTGAYRAMSQGGETGTIVPVGDIASASHAISRYLRDPVLCAATGARGRAFVAQNHPVEQEAKAIDAVYESLWRR